MMNISSLWDVLQIQLLQISVLILLVGIVSWLMHNRNPHIVFALWAVVFVKCLTPPWLTSPVGLFAWQAPPSQVSDDLFPVPRPHVFECVDVPELTGIARNELNQSAANGDSESATRFSSPIGVEKPQEKNYANDASSVERERLARQPSTPDQNMASQALLSPIASRNEIPETSELPFSAGWTSIKGSLVAIWLAGIFLIMATAVRQWSCCWLTIRKSRIQPDGPLQETLNRVKRQLGFQRPVRLVVSDGNYGPLVFGYFRPVLVLPIGVVQQSPLRSLDTVIAHELIHVRRGDTLLCILQFIAQTIWWFNPLVRWASRATDNVSERCCDIEVVSSLKCKRSEYVRSLLGVIEMRHALKCVAGSAGIRASDITFRRLKWLAEQRRSLPLGTPWASWLIASVAALLVLPSAGFPRQQEHPGIKTAEEAVHARDQEAHNAFEKQDWETTAKLYRSIVDENPESGLAWFRLGYALQALGKIDEAIIAHEKASEFRGARRSALYNLACALCIKGEYDKAMDKLTAALDAGYARPVPLDEDEDFAPIKDNERFRKLVDRHKEAVIANGSNQSKVSRGSMSTERGSTGTPAPRVVDSKSMEQLAFWHGTWDVTDAEGKALGSSVVSLDNEKHVIVETWTGLDNSTGSGESLFDPVSSLWIQNFQGSDRKYNLAGEFDGKSLDMSGRISIDGKRVQYLRWNLTKQEDGRLKRTMKTSGDQGISWETLSTGFYVPSEKQ